MWLVLSAAFAGTRCDADALQEGVEALRVIDEQHASELATAVLSEGCKLPGPLGEALEAVPQVSPDHRALFDAKMVAEAPELWVAACAGGVPVVVQTSQVAPIDKRRLLWAGCELIGLGAFTEAEWTAAPGLLYAPILFHQLLEDVGAEPEVTRILARALAGLPVKDEPAVVREFEPLFP